MKYVSVHKLMIKKFMVNLINLFIYFPRKILALVFNWAELNLLLFISLSKKEKMCCNVFSR